MFMSKQKFTKLVAGLIVTSTITVGAISPSSAMASQPNFNNDVESNQQYEIMQEYITNRHAASQFTFNEDGDLIQTVTPKADFRSHNRNFQNVAIETPVVETPVVETPVVETPVIETPVVETPVVETPVIDEEATDASIQNTFYTHLFDAYDKLLSLYDKLLSSFLPSIAN